VAEFELDTGARMERRKRTTRAAQLVMGVLTLVMMLASVCSASAAAPRGGPNCGGEMPAAKPDGSSWTCTFDDEFDASTGDVSSLNASWWVPQVTATSGFTSGPSGFQACYLNSPNNISVSGGVLHLVARREAAPIKCGWFSTQYTAGMVSTYTKFSQTYGRFEVRALLPQATVAGLQETFWLWPLSSKYGSWPASGEIDFSEFYSQYSTLDVPYLHYNFDPASTDLASGTNVVTAYNCQIQLSGYNSYALTWSPGNLTVTVNGQTCLVDKYVASDGLVGAQPFDQPFFLALTQALGVGTNQFNPATTPLPATTSIDYVRVWK